MSRIPSASPTPRTPRTPPASVYNGHINLAQQRKRAKELLTRLRDLTAASEDSSQRSRQLRMLAERDLASRPTGSPHAPGAAHPPQLADAQWLIARELGFASWPRLKAHVDAIAFAARHPQFAADDEPQTQHWRCGNDIAHSLRTAGFQGEFHMFADPLCMGPVPAFPDRADSPGQQSAEFIETRSAFIASAFDMTLDDARARMRGEYDALARLPEARRAVLWCDADAYDQLFLIAVLATLAGMEGAPQRLELVEVDRVPGVDRFIGIGQLAPEVLAWLWRTRRPLDASALALARTAWAAYRSASPEAWAAIAHRPTPALPFLAPALRRQLQELPSLRDGLSLTERMVLEVVDALGRPTLGQVFAELNGRREPLPFLGDSMFHAMVLPLIDVARPLLTSADGSADGDRDGNGERDGGWAGWPRRPVALTPLGRQVLAGEAYWIDHAEHERWIGGVRILPGRAHWALDDSSTPAWRAER